MDDLPIPEFLRRTPEQTAVVMETVRRLNAADRRKQRASYRRAIGKASTYIDQKRLHGRKSIGQCRALERLGYTKYAINNMSRGQADEIIVARRTHVKGTRP